MTDNNDTRIAGFMNSNFHEIDDNGFSERVINSLPQRVERLFIILRLVCFIICAVLFVTFNGTSMIYNFIDELLTAKSHIMSQNLNYTSLIIAVVACVYIGFGRLCSIKW